MNPETLLAVAGGSAVVGVVGKILFDVLRVRVNGKADPGAAHRVLDPEQVGVTQAQCDRNVDSIKETIAVHLGAQTKTIEQMRDDNRSWQKKTDKTIDQLSEQVVDHEVSIRLLQQNSE